MMEMVRSRYYLFIEKAGMLLLLIYPTCMLTVKGGMNGVFLLILLLSLAAWAVRPRGLTRVTWKREWTPYVAAMFSLSAAILISQTWLHDFSARPHDAASRYWLAIPIFLLLHRLRPGTFSALQFAFPIAAIAGFLLMKDMGGEIVGRSGIKTLDLIHFGDFELMLGVLSLFSIDWLGRDRFALRLLKVSGFVAGLSASFASGTRGGWLAIPVFIVIYFYFRTGAISPKKIAATVATTLIAASLLFTFNASLHQRIAKLTTEMLSAKQDNRDTSTGIRLQLYMAAADVFVRHPVFGVGPQGFALEMQPMMEAGKITPIAADLGRGEVHNDILSKAAGMGLFGLIAILAIYFIPFRLFWRASRSTSGFVKRSGVLGLTFVSGVFVFGLTVEFLNLTLATAFYSFTVAVLLAACHNSHPDDSVAAHPNKDIQHV